MNEKHDLNTHRSPHKARRFPTDPGFYEADTERREELQPDPLAPSDDHPTVNDTRPGGAQAKVLEALSREAMAAVERYEDAIERTTDDRRMGELLRVHAEQTEALERLQATTIDKGGRHQASSGAVGAVTAVAGRAARVLGEDMMMRALEAGEELRRRRLDKAVQREDMDEDVVRLLRHQLIPQQERHVSALSRLNDMVKS